MEKKINIKDWGLMELNPDGDPNFSAEHNKNVIEETIRKTERLRRQKRREYEEALKERTWAAARYVKNIDKGSGESDPIKFFGKDYTLYLKGKEIIEKIQEELKPKS